MPSEYLSGLFIDAAERRILPDAVLRAGMRRLCQERLTELYGPTREAEQARLNQYIRDLKSMPIAVHTQEANEQHYEVPARFFQIVLGKNLKYSSCFYEDLNADPALALDAAEDESLKQTMDRAELRDGMTILELGCGWGSLTLSMAKRYPNAKITAVSNSHGQREFIEARAKERDLKNITVLTRNIADPETLASSEYEKKFDRVVSVEMFEHLKNYEALFAKISGLLKNDGKLFVHIFTHREFPYPFETEGESNWMGKYFFTGGQMPSHDLFLHFQERLCLENQWAWSGQHYSKTAEGWLKRQDENKTEIMQIFEETYGADKNPNAASRWFNRWRMFFMACSELFGLESGNQWGVSHYLFKNKP
jgi:cyclopropane-fatty-acyl-phospholipid synthase